MSIEILPPKLIESITEQIQSKYTDLFEMFKQNVIDEGGLEYMPYDESEGKLLTSSSAKYLEDRIESKIEEFEDYLEYIEIPDEFYNYVNYSNDWKEIIWEINGLCADILLNRK